MLIMNMCCFTEFLVFVKKIEKNLKKFQKRGCQNFKPMVLYTSAEEIRRERKTN